MRGDRDMSTGTSPFGLMEAQLRDWQEDLQNLNKEIQKVDGDDRIRYREKIKVLHKKTEEMQQTLRSIRKRDGKNQAELEEDLGNAWTSLKENFTKAKVAFKRGYREGRKS
jgi:hypothetical protein